jgi:hypothetical protein
MSHLLFGLVWVGMLGANEAQAASATARFCVNYSLSFSDSWALSGPPADDRWNDAGTFTEPALGMRYAVLGRTPSGGSFPAGSGWLFSSGATEGCTPLLFLDSTNTYDVYLTSRARVGAHTVEVRASPASPILYGVMLWNHWAPVAGTTLTEEASLPVSDWSVLLATARETIRSFDPAGVETFLLYPFGENPMMTDRADVDGDGDEEEVCTAVTVTTPPLPSNNRNCGGAVFLRPEYTRRRYAIAHELGHTIWNRMIPSTSTSGDFVEPDPGFTPCETNAGTHGMAEVESTGLAITEGWAHYVAARTWNDPASTECWFHYWNSVDWYPGLLGDESHFLGNTSYYSGNYAYEWSNWVDCEGSSTWIPIETVVFGLEESVELHTGFPSGNYGGEICRVEPESGVTTEFDWLRHFWDLSTDGGRTHHQLLSLMADSDPSTWTTAIDGPLARQPAARLAAAADSAGVGMVWTNWGDYNGISY